MRLSVKATIFSAAIFVMVDQPAYSFSGHSSFDKNPSSIVMAVSDQKAEGAEKFIDSMARNAIAFLGDGSLSDSDKQKKFSRLLNNSFDMNTIGRFALGRYWRVSSAQQRKEYQSLFRDMIVEVYSRRFGEYNGQTIEVRDSRRDSEKDVTVNSFIIPQDGGQEIQVDWRVRYKNGQYKVIDVMVEGVSMALTQRSDFSSVIQRGGGEVSVLLDHLHQQ